MSVPLGKVPSMPGAPTLTDGVVTLRAHRDDDVDAVVRAVPGPAEPAVDDRADPYTRADGDPLRARGRCRAGGPTARLGLRGRGRGSLRRHRRAARRGRRPGRDRVRLPPGVRGTGAIERAGRLLLEWGFTERGVRTVVVWRAHVGNWASRRLAWRLGFSFDGTLRGASCPSGGELVDGWSARCSPPTSGGPADVAGGPPARGRRRAPPATGGTADDPRIARPPATSARSSGSAGCPPLHRGRGTGLARAPAGEPRPGTGPELGRSSTAMTTTVLSPRSARSTWCPRSRSRSATGPPHAPDAVDGQRLLAGPGGPRTRGGRQAHGAGRHPCPARVGVGPVADLDLDLRHQVERADRGERTVSSSRRRRPPSSGPVPARGSPAGARARPVRRPRCRGWASGRARLPSARRGRPRRSRDVSLPPGPQPQPPAPSSTGTPPATTARPRIVGDSRVPTRRRRARPAAGGAAQGAAEGEPEPPGEPPRGPVPDVGVPHDGPHALLGEAPSRAPAGTRAPWCPCRVPTGESRTRPRPGRRPRRSARRSRRTAVGLDREAPALRPPTRRASPRGRTSRASASPYGVGTVVHADAPGSWLCSTTPTTSSSRWARTVTVPSVRVGAPDMQAPCQADRPPATRFGA